MDLDARLLAEGDGDVTVRVELSDAEDVAATAIGHLVINPCGPGGSDVDLDGMHTSLSPTACWSIRRLLGFNGTALVSQVLGGGATRTDPAAIAAYVDCLATDWLDLDQNGEARAFSDGLDAARRTCSASAARL